MDWLDSAPPKSVKGAFPPLSPTEMVNAPDNEVNVPASTRFSKFLGDNPTDGFGRSFLKVVVKGRSHWILKDFATKTLSAKILGEPLSFHSF
jgi:hypothetical protein